MKKLTFADFVVRATKVHESRYQYPEQQYYGKRGKVQIECPVHGMFLQLAHGHLQGTGCPTCGEAVRVAQRKIPMFSFIARAQALYGDWDSFEFVEYKNTMTPVVITCAFHGDYAIRPHNYLCMGQRCSQCATEGRLVSSKVKTFLNAKHRQRLQTDPIFAMCKRLRKRLRESMVKRHLVRDKLLAEVLGCTYEELRKHMELKFKDGMSWDNMHLWHIDHIVPLATARTLDEVYTLNHYLNLQPLWALDNLKKNARLPDRFAV